MPWRPVLLPQERTAHLSSTLKTLSWSRGEQRWPKERIRAGLTHHLCSTGNGDVGGISQEVKV